MKVLSIEGLDKAGKYTALHTLREYFESQGLTVAVFSLPNYESPVGAAIRQWLTGAFDADPKVFELLQAADKQDAASRIERYREAGMDVLIIDRYIHSMLAYGAYDNDPDWLESLTRYITPPDAVVYMDVDASVSMARKGKHGDNDKYEGDLSRLVGVRTAYHHLLHESVIDPSVRVFHVDANEQIESVTDHVLTHAKTMVNEWF